MLLKTEDFRNLKNTTRWRNIGVGHKSGDKMSNIRLLVGVNTYFIVDISCDMDMYITSI